LDSGVRPNPNPDGYSGRLILLAPDLYFSYSFGRNVSLLTRIIIFDISSISGPTSAASPLTDINWKQELPSDVTAFKNLTIKADNAARGCEGKRKRNEDRETVLLIL
jgi:hypothetical protein